MKLNKKILFVWLIFMIMIFGGVLDYNVSATQRIITYNGINTVMPEISKYEESVDPEAPYNNKINMLDSVNNIATWGESISVIDLISKFEDENTYVGIDVSKWQGEIDWEQVKSSGVKYVMIRCGFRGYGSNGTLVKDPNFDIYIQGALKNDLYVGVYFFSAAITEEEAIQEAQFVLDCVQNYDIKYPIAYDFEYFGEIFDDSTGNAYRTNGLTNEQIKKNAKAFLGYIKNNSDYRTMLYGGEYYLDEVWEVNEFVEENDIWLANYPSTITSNISDYAIAPAMWQCTDEGNVPGINALVDLNFDYKYYTLLEKEYDFFDVTEEMWFYDSVRFCRKNKIILGYEDGTFGPNDIVTRGMFVTILHRMAGSPEVDESQIKEFPDIEDGAYYQSAVKWAATVGVVHGYENGTFGPNDFIMRQDLTIMLRNYVSVVLKQDISVIDEKNLLIFEDYFNVDEYALESVLWAVENKVVTGKISDEKVYIDPKGHATRAETAAVLHKYIVNCELGEE